MQPAKRKRTVEDEEVIQRPGTGANPDPASTSIVAGSSHHHDLQASTSSSSHFYWDFEADLERLKAILSHTSSTERETLRNVIAQFLEGNIITKGRIGNPNIDVNLPLIRRTIWLLIHFQRDLGQNGTTANSNTDGTHQPDVLQTNAVEKKDHQNARILGLTLKDLKEICSSLENFFKAKFLDSELKVKENPFQNHLIVSKILENLPTKLLPNCRLINRQWNTIAVSMYRKTHNYLNFTDNLVKFNSDMKYSADYPFAKFTFQLGKTAMDDWLTFFLVYGRHVKHLEIREAGNYRRKFIPTPEYQLKLRTALRNVPQLESLTLGKLCGSVTLEPILTQSISIEERNKFQLPKLESLSLDFSTTRVMDVSSAFLEDLLDLTRNIKCLSLNSFPTEKSAVLGAGLKDMNLREFVTVKSGQQTGCLSQLHQQKFKALSIKIPNNTEAHDAAMHLFLKSQSDSLEYLSFELGRISTRPDFRLPVMNKLRKLELHYCGPFCCHPLSTSVESLPVLRILTINLKCFKSAFLGIVVKSVTELRITSPTHKHRSPSSSYIGTLMNIDTCFPNLESLKIQMELDDEELGTVFSEFSRIKELELVVHYGMVYRNINYVLSGLPDPELEDEEWLLPQLIEMKSAVLLKIKPPRPSLRDLEGLSQLTLKFVSYSDEEFKIDEIGVDYGFLRKHRLGRLTLLGNFSISETDALNLSAFHSNVHLLHDTPTPAEFHWFSDMDSWNSGLSDSDTD